MTASMRCDSVIHGPQKVDAVWKRRREGNKEGNNTKNEGRQKMFSPF
jgi:hypothetical protein